MASMQRACTRFKHLARQAFSTVQHRIRGRHVGYGLRAFAAAARPPCRQHRVRQHSQHDPCGRRRRRCSLRSRGICLPSRCTKRQGVHRRAVPARRVCAIHTGQEGLQRLGLRASSALR